MPDILKQRGQLAEEKLRRSDKDIQHLPQQASPINAARAAEAQSRSNGTLTVPPPVVLDKSIKKPAAIDRVDEVGQKPARTGIPGLEPDIPVSGVNLSTKDEPVEAEPFNAAKAELETIFKGREGKVDELVKAIQGKSTTRESAFDRLFGEESRISRFFAPSVQAVQEQILDTEELLTNLRTDIQEGEEDVGLSQGQFRRIEAKERGDLVGQLDKLTRSQSRLQAGLDTQILLSDKEFNNVMQEAQDGIDALTFKLEQEGVADEAEISLIKRALEDDLNQQSARAAEDRRIAEEIRIEEAQIRQESREEKAQSQQFRKEAVRDILLQAQDFVLEAGVVPTENFQTVINDVNRMAEEGKSLAEIQLSVLKAVGQNDQVRQFINLSFQKAKKSVSTARGGSGKSASGPKLSSTQVTNLLAAGADPATLPTHASQLTQDQAKTLSGNNLIQALIGGDSGSASVNPF